MKLEIITADITGLAVDAIVNAANTGLRQGSGVCGAIFAKAGAKQLTAACQKIGGCPTGEAVITPGFALKAQYIIHTPGPIWSGGNKNEEQLLYNCYQSSMKLAADNGCHSIAFPLISSGIFGYPKEDAWRVAIKSINDYHKSNPNCNLDVYIAVLDESAQRFGEKVLIENLQ